MKRYNPIVKHEYHGGFLQAIPGMIEDSEGKYVLYEDHIADKIIYEVLAEDVNSS